MLSSYSLVTLDLNVVSANATAYSMFDTPNTPLLKPESDQLLMNKNLNMFNQAF